MDSERYKADLKKLMEKGELLRMSMAIEINPETKKGLDKDLVKALPNFKREYQIWYSEAHRLIAQLLPSRLVDFESHYKPPKTRKEISYGNYKIEDYLKSIVVTRGWEKEQVVGIGAAWPEFNQQISILQSLEGRFESSLFEIRTLVQADLFADELDAADAILKQGFTRGAGAMAGVVLEGHLRTVCDQHGAPAPKSATLGKLNDHAKDKGVLDLPTWRFIQHLADIRNLCDHKLPADPTKDQVTELIQGVRKITKTVM